MDKVSDYIDIDLLEETNISQVDWYREDDICAYLSKLNSLDRSWLVALLADYWSGKTTFLKELERYDSKNNNNIRIHFDARQYPDRTQLRDWFVLMLAARLLPDIQDGIKDKIDWKTQNYSISWLIQSVEQIANVPPILSSILKDNSDLPIKRIFEYEDCLKKILIAKDQSSIDLLKDNKFKTIYIVLEDVDRSWQDWLFFLETIKNFIDRYYSDLADYSIFKRMVVVCPVARQSWDNDFERYLKVFTRYDFFTYNKALDAKHFVDSVFKFDQDIKDILYVLIDYCLDNLNHNYRLLKFIIRNIIKEYVYRIDNQQLGDINLARFIAFNLIAYKLRDDASRLPWIRYHIQSIIHWSNGPKKINIFRSIISLGISQSILSSQQSVDGIAIVNISSIVIKPHAAELKLGTSVSTMNSLEVTLHIPGKYIID